MDFGDFPEYVTVAERKKKAQAGLEKQKKKNPALAPIKIEGRTIAKTWWGKAWNANLERYSDYANRIGRGRSYLRHGAVLDLQIAPGEITALVQGSRAKPYKVKIAIQGLQQKIWEQIVKDCADQIGSLQELMAGKFPQELAEVFMTPKKGLFPAPSEITFDCSCPDWAIMCKHVAAVLYGVGVRLDESPALFFDLRKVKIDDLIAKTVQDQTQSMLAKSAVKSRRIMKDADLARVFGIDLEMVSAPTHAPAPTSTSAPAAARAPRGRGRPKKAT
jgi:uncharacterized Zn finger protein